MIDSGDLTDDQRLLRVLVHNQHGAGGKGRDLAGRLAPLEQLYGRGVRNASPPGWCGAGAGLTGPVVRRVHWT